MISTKEITARDEEEGVEDEEGQKEGAARLAGAASEGSTHDHFISSCATLRRIDSLLMAPMT